MILDDLIMYCEILSECNKRTDDLERKAHNMGYIAGVIACMRAMDWSKSDINKLKRLLDEMVV